MAVVAFNTPIEDPNGGHMIYQTPATLTTNDTSAVVDAPNNGDRSVQVDGNFGTNATVTIQGANTKVEPAPGSSDWQTLRDSFGANLTFTAAGLKQIHERCRWMQASVASGTSPALRVIFFLPRRTS